ncbi:putative WD repeat-containing protein [Porphyridium purpureum]|uniref:Putative WD repeat-containing protein n=1 Tax=Porphyridium purpureum TaxID=35688 RepID=A0A5J4YMQ2_PORPP|nr:putative WD repeat-containing protein [Porphyridium purpureum]|eukprot:POR8590..scf246_12
MDAIPKQNDALTLPGHSDWVSGVDFAPDGRHLASCSDDGTIKLWDPRKGHCMRTLRGHKCLVLTIQHSPDGELLASGSNDHTIRLWNVRTGMCEHATPPYSSRSEKGKQGHKAGVASVSFSKDGNYLAAGDRMWTIRVWNPRTGEYVRTMVGHVGWISSVDYSPDGRYILAGCHDATIGLWEPISGDCVHAFKRHTSLVFSVKFSPCGKYVVSGSHDKRVNLWSMETGEIVRSMVGHRKAVRAVAFSPRGEYIASGSYDHTIRLWETRSGNCVRVLEGHTAYVHCLAFSPDGKTLASGSYDETVKLWDISDLNDSDPGDGSDIAGIRDTEPNRGPASRFFDQVSGLGDSDKLVGADARPMTETSKFLAQPSSVWQPKAFNTKILALGARTSRISAHLGAFKTLCRSRLAGRSVMGVATNLLSFLPAVQTRLSLASSGRLLRPAVESLETQPARAMSSTLWKPHSEQNVSVAWHYLGATHQRISPCRHSSALTAAAAAAGGAAGAIHKPHALRTPCPKCRITYTCRITIEYCITLSCGILVECVIA